MPARSPEIANEFIRLAAADRQYFNQAKLQQLTGEELLPRSRNFVRVKERVLRTRTRSDQTSAR
jgi:hypothetical protein